MSIKRTITIGDRKKKAVQEEEKPLFKRRPNPKGKHLVVVESPAKAKTIERILGSDYKVMASMGHLRDLPQRTLGVDVNHGFTPQYVDSAGRETLIKDLQKEANRSRDILLATDPDCDRVGIAVKNKTGEYELLTGNQTGMLLLDYICSQRQRHGKMPVDPVMVKTIVTMDMGESDCFSLWVTYDQCTDWI